MTLSRTLRIAIVCGGHFPEGDVSRRNARTIQKALEVQGYTEVFLVEYQQASWTASVSSGHCDVVVCAVDGPHGEGGVLQGYLEALNIPFTGSGVHASALSQRKSSFKAFCRGIGLRTPNWILLPALGSEHVSALELFDQLGPVAFVKPNSQGSSFGVMRATSADEMEIAIESARKYDSEVLLEKNAHGQEVTIGIFTENQVPRTLHPIVVSSADGYLSRGSKADNRISVAPAETVLSIEQISHLREAAKLLYIQAGCRGICRLDAIATQEDIEVLEMNTFPGVIPSHIYATPESATECALQLQRPVVFTGLAAHIRACRTWNLPYLSHLCGHEIVKVRITSLPEGDQISYRDMPLCAYLKLLEYSDTSASSPDYYLSDWVPPAVLRDDLCETRRLYNLAHRLPRSLLSTWPYYFIQVGGMGAHYHAHRDFLGSNAWSFQIHGRKRWRMWYETTIIEDILLPGEVLYLPGRWWHDVTSLDTTLSFVMNQWSSRSTIPFALSLADREERRLLLRLLGLHRTEYYL